MIKNIQTRLHTGSEPQERGNCYPTVISCILEMPVEDVLQFQEIYHTNWYEPLLNWLFERGYDIEYLGNHLYDDSYYFVTGTSPRNNSIMHVVIYQNGKMVHDPHPDNTGILTEDSFERLIYTRDKVLNHK